jgi:ribose transport system ATP-binding protein
VFRRPAERRVAPRLGSPALRHRRSGRRLPHARRRNRRPGRLARRRPGGGRPGAVRREPRPAAVVLDGAAARSSLARRRWLGVNLVCADRVGESMVPNLSVRENLFLNPLAAGAAVLLARAAPRGRAARRSARRWACGRTTRSRDRAAVGRQSAEGRGRALAASGGEALCLRGSDRRRRRRREGGDLPLFDVALQAGAAILIVSTDFEEVAKVCHRALVFDRGRVVSELPPPISRSENLLAAASANIARAAIRG